MTGTIQPEPSSSMLSSQNKGIMIIGGAEDKVHGREILHTFFNRSGGTDASIAIIPCASREPTLIGDRYERIFREMGAPNIYLLDVRDRANGEDPRFLEWAKECTGVFMTGGDQLRLCGLLADTPLMQLILQRVHNGEIAIAGTSAGAAVMGHHMIAGGGSGESPNRSLVDMAMGFGIVPEILVDQHFYNRNRLARLFSAISYHPELLALGIDEDTCAIFERNGWINIMGKGAVTILDMRALSNNTSDTIETTAPISLHNMKIHVLTHGDRYHLTKHQAIAASAP
jgi:cyanophycinase